MSSQRPSLNEYKADFTSSYNEKMPHKYFVTMQSLEYQIPENAQPNIEFLIEYIKKKRPGIVSILDLGCSYGVLSALIQFRIPLKVLYERYKSISMRDMSYESESRWYASQSRRTDLTFYGIDISENAIDFATSVGLLADGVATNLEDDSNTPDQLSRLPQDLDLIISTGCVGYITDTTFKKVLKHVAGGRPPIIASFVIRLFDYSRIKAEMSKHGFRTFKLPETTFIQRRFKDTKEQSQILSLLKSDDISQKESEPPESDGFYHAELFVSIH